jgi:Trypsin
VHLGHVGAALALVLAIGLQAAPIEAVVGGVPARAGSAPWFAKLPLCGGALIAPDRVATAAHCVAGLPLRDLRSVRFGSGVERAATGIAVDPGYVRRALAGTANLDAPAGDVALVTLDRPVTGVTPLRLRRAAPARGTRAVVFGAGQTSVPRVAQLPSLRRATLAVISDGACRDFYRSHGGRRYRSALRPATMVCATDPDGRRPFRSACTGDSGGPLVAGSTLAGIVSWGLRCGGERDPTVFTDPAANRDFLRAAAPVLAPVAADAPAVLSGEARVGATLTCTSPAWLRAPTRLTFAFDSYRFGRGHTTPQAGPSATYVVRPADAGRVVACLATGSTAGGWETTRPSEGLRIAGA